MWKHEIIDSLRFLKTCAHKDLLDICKAAYGEIADATEFFIGDVDGHLQGIEGQFEEESVSFFSQSDGSALPYDRTILTFYKNDNDGAKRKFALLLTSKDEIISAIVFSFDFESLLWIPPFCAAFIDRGECSIRSMVNLSQNDNGLVDSAKTTNACMWIALYFLRLMHVKNIFHQPVMPSAGMNRKRARRGDSVAEKYYTLVFSAPGASIKKDQATGEYRSGVLPFHFCRGHFRHVEENKPLFGRRGCYGTFWIPSHARGDRKNGIVTKDYEVLACG